MSNRDVSVRISSRNQGNRGSRAHIYEPSLRRTSVDGNRSRTSSLELLRVASTDSSSRVNNSGRARSGSNIGLSTPVSSKRLRKSISTIDKPNSLGSTPKDSMPKNSSSTTLNTATSTPSISPSPIQKEKEKKKKHRKSRSIWSKIGPCLGIYYGNIVLKDPRAIEAVQALGLNIHHLRKLKARFDKIDIDGSNSIDYEEFFESVGQERSPFTDKLFQLIDLDSSGTIEFDEYVRVMATYCMFTKDEILRFCFECFDVDRSGTIDEKEFIELCKCVNNGSPTFPNNFKKGLEEFDVNEDGLIDYSEFLEIDRRYPLVLFPAFRLQDVMQRNSLGERTWIKIIENYQEMKRIEEYKAKNNGKSPPVPFFKQIMGMCTSPPAPYIPVGADMEKRHRKGMK